MIVSLLVAMDERRGIGLAGGLPWRLSSDLQRFKSLTTGHHIIMGRKTYESIGRLLPGRTMIVITRNPDFRPPGCLVAHSLGEALALSEARGEEEVFVIGGRAVFTEALPLADRMYLTEVHTAGQADVFFPDLQPQEWEVKEAVYTPADERNEFPFTLKRLERIYQPKRDC